MTGSLLERIQSSYNKIEELAKDLPGYKGYKDKELRREADKLVRMKVARGFGEQRRRLNSIVVKLVSAGRLRLVMTLDRALMRMDLLVDRLKLASYGYAGLFDAIKIREPELDALYNFDAALLDSVTRVRGLVDAVAAAESDDEVAQAGDDLLEALDEINETFGKRQDAFLETTSV